MTLSKRQIRNLKRQGISAEIIAEITTHWQGTPQQPVHASAKTPRNAPCPCGSGRKYKNCCLRKEK